MARTSDRSGHEAAVQGARLILILCACALTLIGLVMVFSASSVKAIDEGSDPWRYVQSQIVFAVVGAATAAFLWRFVPYRFWSSRAVWAVWAIACLLILAVAFAGTSNYGAKRWLNIGPVSTQPSELCKIAFLLVAVRIMADYQSGATPFRAVVLRFAGFVLLPLVVLYETQSDLGTTAICLVGILAVLWMGGMPLKWLVAIAGVLVAFGLASIFLTSYRSDRLVFLDPWNDGQDGYGSGYNIIRSYYALAEGGIFGVGLGNSHEKFQYLFASESDFIFAVIGEELGLLGALVVIGLFLGILYAGLRIASHAPDEVGAMIAGGCTVMLVFQAFLNIACVIGVFPTTGKPLPFISAGGSSMLASFILLGLILSVSRADTAPSIYEQRRSDLRLVKQEPVGDRRSTRSSEPAARSGRPSSSSPGRPRRGGSASRTSSRTTAGSRNRSDGQRRYPRR